jgi:hypothetical protein
MKKIGVVITDGVGFRNFILSDFIQESQKIFGEVVVLSCLPKEVYTEINPNLKVIELDIYKENFLTWFLRKYKEVAHLKLHRKNNFGIQNNLDATKSTSKNSRGYATRLIFFIASYFHSEQLIQRFNYWQQQSFKNDAVTKSYSDLLKIEQFDILFFTHQRPPFIAPLVYQAEQIKLKTVSFIFSWDNLASKGRMAANFDHYLVWSDLMKKELQQFYSTVAESDIEVVGTPQFESYVLDRYASTKSDFYKKFGLDLTKKTICFSCGDSSTSRNDELYIETIAEAIKSGEIQNANLLVRTSPAEDPVRFQSLVNKYDFVRWNHPKWKLSREGHQEVWSQRIPAVEDVIDLRGSLEHTDLNLNMLSTMSLDFIQFDKPVINTVFGNPENGLYDDQKFLKYEHIINVVNSKATRIAKNKNELIDTITMYLTNPSIDQENRKQLLQMQVSKPLEGTGKRIAEALLKWA